MKPKTILAPEMISVNDLQQMQREKQQIVKLVVGLEQKKIGIQGLSLQIDQSIVLLEKTKCRIILPLTNVISMAKKDLSLLIFINDPDRPLPEDNWQQDEQIQETEEQAQLRKMDELLFSMLANVESGGSFNNNLKANFQLQLQFTSLEGLRQTQTSIESSLRKIQQQLQQAYLQMEIEPEPILDCEEEL